MTKFSIGLKGYSDVTKPVMPTINLIVRAIVTVVGIALVNGCGISLSRYPVPLSVNPTPIVQINRHLEIPNLKARVYIQNGAEITMRHIDKLSTYCSVLMQDLHTEGGPKLTVSPGQFEIIKVRKFNDYSYFPGTFVTSLRWLDEFPRSVIFEVEMRLKSAAQPGVRALFCAKQVLVFSPVYQASHYPTLAEMRFALGNAIEIKTP